MCVWQSHVLAGTSKPIGVRGWDAFPKPARRPAANPSDTPRTSRLVNTISFRGSPHRLPAQASIRRMPAILAGRPKASAI